MEKIGVMMLALIGTVSVVYGYSVGHELFAADTVESHTFTRRIKESPVGISTKNRFTKSNRIGIVQYI